MQKKIDMLNKTFGKLIVIADYGRTKHNEYQWLCKCDCGNKTIVSGYRLRNSTRSCGCLIRESKFIHGHASRKGFSKTYRSWQNMHTRCRNPNTARNYKYYQQTGIKVCERWNKFENFLEDMGNPPTQKHTLDRINPYGNYEPSNCRWATWSEQQRNKRKYI